MFRSLFHYERAEASAVDTIQARRASPCGRFRSGTSTARSPLAHLEICARPSCSGVKGRAEKN